MTFIHDGGAMQYTAHCPKCMLLTAIARAQVATGRPPLCELCGTEMTVTRSDAGAGLKPAPTGTVTAAPTGTGARKVEIR